MSLPVFQITAVWTCDGCGRKGEAGCWGQPPGQRLPTEDQVRALGMPPHWVGEFGSTFCGTTCMVAWARERGLMEFRRTPGEGETP